ncbi:MAG TPA: tetratricopeptide repeat protein, partial [Methylomirabilota bacterium]|nr:tetratricopeptide repeat protein [Methylomirabilota bacterium]
TPHHSPGPEAAVYELARQQKHREVIAAIGVLERAGPLSWPMELQRLYAWQALGEHATALERAGQLAATHPDSPELALIRSDLLIAAGQVVEAGQLLQTVTARHGGADAAEKARSRLESLPPIANPDRRWWGEAYASGDWHDRWGTLIGSGFVRHGAFLPGARWAQPYAEFRFGVDTDSEAGPDRTIIQDNFIGAFAGARVQPIASEYFFLYAQAGTSTDLLDRRAGGAWAFDYQVGLYGYKAWGPGMNLLAAGGTSGTNTSAWWRAGLGDWWADAGADFSWYGRYDSWIGYGQARQGLRLAQVGPRVAFDAYVLEGLSWDVKGNYFDNLIEAGPGLRLVWRPHARWQVVARTEFVGGWYLGRDRPGDRAGTGRTYDDLRLGVAVGTRW